MTILLASGLVGAVAALAAAGAGIVYFAKRALNRSDKFAQALEQIFALRRANDGYERTVGDLERSIANTGNQLARERATLELMEEQRDRAVKRLVELGDPQSIADAANDSIGRLRNLGKKEP